MIRQILQIPEPVLRERCTEVPAGWEEGKSIRKLFADLLDTMRTHHAIGLAANQIGVPFRVIAISPRTDCPWHIMVNPVITSRSGAVVAGEEGCMSIDMGRKKFRVKRDQKITVRFYNQQGAEVEWKAAGLAARVIQHEIEHLDGVLIDQARPAPLAKGWECAAAYAAVDAMKENGIPLTPWRSTAPSPALHAVTDAAQA